MLNDPESGEGTSTSLESEADPGQPTIYQIRVRSHLGPGWADWFEGLTITQQENGDTLLTGSVIDQSALHGLLKKVRDLGMALVSVNEVQPCEIPLEKGAANECKPEDSPNASASRPAAESEH